MFRLGRQGGRHRNCSGDEVDKFKQFGLTPVSGTKVAAPLIRECFANLECRIADARLVKVYNFFILEVLKARVVSTPNILELFTTGVRGFSSPVVINKRQKFTKWKNAPNF